MFSRFGRGVLAAVAATAVLAGAGAVVNSAAPNPVAGGPAGAGLCSGQASTARAAATVADLRAFGACEIGRRMTTLSQLSSVVAAAKGLTSSDASTLSGYIGASRSGLTRLKATLDAETRLPAARADILRIVAGYRVYVLLGPQVRLTIAADSELALKPHFDQMAATLAGRISAAQAGGKDVATAQAALDAMNAAVGAAAGLAAPVRAQLLSLTVAKYNAGGAAPVIRNARTALIQARNDFKSAAQDGRNVLAALK